MVMSSSEWNALMNRLPPEDRTSYEDYLASLTPPPPPPPADTFTPSFTEYWENSAEYWAAMGDKYAAEAAELERLADELVKQQASSPVIPPVTPVIPPVTPVIPPVSPVVPPRVTPVIPPVIPPVVPPVVPPVIPPVTPVTPPVTPPPPKPPMVKSATPDIVQFNDDALPAEVIADLLFENVGGQELLMIARYDTVNGQSVLYQPIVNLDLLQQEYNPNNLIKLQDTSNIIFGNFPIPLETKIPNVGTGANATNMYIDSTGSLVIEFVNLRSDEIVEVQISSNGTIYEVGI